MPIIKSFSKEEVEKFGFLHQDENLLQKEALERVTKALDENVVA